MLSITTDNKENYIHTDRRGATYGAYEWLYFDARSHDEVWTIVVIWFLGNPFSDYSLKINREQQADPFEHNGFYFALHRHGKLYAYHFSRFPVGQVLKGEGSVDLSLGRNSVKMTKRGVYELACEDRNANGRNLKAFIKFRQPGSPVHSELGSVRSIEALASGAMPKANHMWMPAAPLCNVEGTIELTEERNYGIETISFVGEGYHDHNWGRLPFSPIREWYWARVNFYGPNCLVLYHLTGLDHEEQTIIMQADSGGSIRELANGRIFRPGSGAAGSTSLPKVVKATAGDLDVTLTLHRRLDASPFYTRADIRAICISKTSGSKQLGAGTAEVFRPGPLTSPIVASALKTRIVEQ